MGKCLLDNSKQEKPQEEEEEEEEGGARLFCDVWSRGLRHFGIALPLAKSLENLYETP